MTKPVFIQKLCLYQYEIPLKTKVFIRGIPFATKKGLIIQIEDKDGNKAWGEVSFLPPTEERIKNCVRWFEENDTCLLGKGDIFSHKIPPEIKFSLASAVEELNFENKDYNDLTVKTNALLAGDYNAIIEEARIKKELGYSIFKLKLGEYSVMGSVDLIIQIREVIGSGKYIVLDLNCQWELSKTLDLAKRILDKDILYIEDPVKNFDELSDYFKLCPIRAGIDEFLEIWDSQLENICEEFLEDIIFVIKPSVLYGKDVWNRIVNDRLCKKVFTSAWETGVGLRGVLNEVFKHIANIEFIGLDTYSFLRYDITEPMLPIMSPQISSKTLKEKFAIIEERMKLIHSWEI